MNPVGESRMFARAETLGILELGTNSLKLHRLSRDLERAEPVRAEWEVGFDICSTGTLSPETVVDALEHIERLLERCQVGELDTVFGVATGVFEEAANISRFLEQINQEFEIPVRVLSGEEQAQLLYLGFQGLLNERPAMIFDLGCGQLELVYLGVGEGREYLHESLPLGVIRIQHVASLFSGVLDEEAAVRYIRVNLRESKGFRVSTIHGTGGTVRALAQFAGTSTLTCDVLARVEEEIRSNGPPRFFSPRRQVIFLPGLLMVRHLLDHVEAVAIQHQKVDLGVVLAEKLQPFYRSMGRQLCDVFINREIDILNW